MEILCFLAGVAFFYYKSPYPLLFLGSAIFFRPKFALLLWFITAIFWSLAHEWLIADQGVPKTTLIPKAHLDGYIVSIPVRTPNRTQFQFLAEHLDGQATNVTLLLACYNHCPDLKAGQHWQLQAKLKKPVNLANPGGFDYVRWLSSRHISWVGNTQQGTFKLNKTSTHHFPLIRFREYISNLQTELDPDEATLGIFQALTLGLVNQVDKSQWDLFRRTGTTHLIDISGEHIAMIAGISYWLLKWIWRHLGQLCLRYPAPKVASAGAMLITFAYALVSGFAVPTQRALITCFFMLIRHFCNQRFSVWQSWRYALLSVLIFEPHSVFMQGFYFSFIAVAILILINQRVRVAGFRKMLSMQLACLFGLMPLTLYWFSYGSINSLVANLVAIPLVSFFIVPLALLITLISPFMVLPWGVTLLKGAISCLLFYLELIDSFALVNVNLTFLTALFPLAVMIAMAIFVFLPLKQLAPATAVIIIASLFPRYEKVNTGRAQIDILDVGQGLAIVVRTANHILLYDTGMKFYQSSDMGKLAIIPYLNTLGVKRLDKVIISHPDLDHRGGLASLEETYDIDELIVDDPDFYKRGLSCHQYPAWHWDGLSFRFFPIIKPLKSKNNHSCVLQIARSDEKILLSGDIEAWAENDLIETYGNKLASTILVIPHHGSKTSSSAAFIEQVAPRYAIASYGFDNRYHFPHPQAMQVYHRHQIPVFNTLDCGMVSVQLGARQQRPACYRQQKPSH